MGNICCITYRHIYGCCNRGLLDDAVVLLGVLLLKLVNIVHSIMHKKVFAKAQKYASSLIAMSM